MLRSAAKNFESVTVVVDPADYARVLAALQASDDDLDLRRLLAEKVFARTAAYDAAIAYWFGCERSEIFPDRIGIPLQNENHHCVTARIPASAPRFTSRRRATASPRCTRKAARSFRSTISSTSRARSSPPIHSTTETCCAIVKHTTPCGLATGDTPLDAYRKALACDPVSAFGSVISITVPVDDETAEAVSSLFVECIVAPEFSPGALEILGRKKNLRVLEGRARWREHSLDYKRVRGGFLAQERAARAGSEARLAGRDEATADRGRMVGSSLCLARCRQREVECDRAVP